MIAVAQFIDNLCRCSEYPENSKDNHTNAACVDDGHFAPVYRLMECCGSGVNTAGSQTSRRNSEHDLSSRAQDHGLRYVPCSMIFRILMPTQRFSLHLVPSATI